MLNDEISLRAPTRGDGLATQAYVALRDAILSHQLPPGTRLSVPEIARRLQVSRSPAREAIARIAYEGLATNEPHQGAVVVQVQRSDLLEIYAVRQVLEGLACRLAVGRLTESGSAVLRQIVDEHAEAIAAEDVDRHYEIDQRFHATIREQAGNARLTEYLDRLQGQIRLAMHTTHRSPGGMAQALTEHEAIVDALASGDPDAAEAAGRVHIARLMDELSAPDPTDQLPVE